MKTAALTCPTRSTRHAALLATLLPAVFGLALLAPLRAEEKQPAATHGCCNAAAPAAAPAPAKGESLTPLQRIPFQMLDGKPASLADYAGKAVLIVNVASRCGNTPQYTALQKLSTDYAARGLVVLAFPCNDFGAQEPGEPQEIRAFCTEKYAVTFPIAEKVHAKGPEQHPLYAALTGPEAKFPGDVKWNFGKFLVGKDGTVLARFEPGVKPDDKAVLEAIEAALR